MDRMNDENTEDLDKALVTKAMREVMQPDYEIARAICEGLDRYDWTIEDLMEESGLPRMTILKMKAIGGGDPRLSQIKKVAGALGYNLVLQFVPVDEETENGQEN